MYFYNHQQHQAAPVTNGGHLRVGQAEGLGHGGTLNPGMVSMVPHPPYGGPTWLLPPRPMAPWPRKGGSNGTGTSPQLQQQQQQEGRQHFVSSSSSASSSSPKTTSGRGASSLTAAVTTETRRPAMHYSPSSTASDAGSSSFSSSAPPQTGSAHHRGTPRQGA